MKVLFVEVSQNAKTGPIPASIIERASCWPGCALYENGCYAETGALAMHWHRVSRGLAGESWSEFCAKVAALRPGRLWRYAQAGDLPGYGPQIDSTLLEELVAANTGKNVIAFTHKPVFGDDPIAVENRRLVAAALSSGFTINLSADCNDVPHMGDADPALENRLHIIPAGKTIPPEKKDKDLLEKLKAEHPAILRWMIEGCVLWLNEGLDRPRAVVAKSEQYFKSENPIARWIEARTEADPIAPWLSTEKLYQDYREFTMSGVSRGWN